MSLERLGLPFACLLIVLGLAGTAAAQQTYLLGGSSGAQLQIGGGLPLPIQLTDAAADGKVDWGSSEMITAPPFGGTMGTAGATPGGKGVFPPLLIPVKAGGAIVMSSGGAGKKLTIPASVLSVAPVQKTLGVFAQNPALYAVGLKLGAKWPAAPATLAPRMATMTAGGLTLMFFGAGGFGASTVYMATPVASRMITVVNPGMMSAPMAPFGGDAPFVLTPSGPGGVNATLPVTVWIKLGISPPCTGCKAVIIAARPMGTQAPGNKAFKAVSTIGTPPVGPNRYTVKVGPPPPPPGTIISAMATATMAFPANPAMSVGFPWTTGTVAVRATGAMGTPEHFFLKGSDMRTAGGAGTIQLVSGALSARPVSGPNGNRGWVRLELVTKVPSIANWGLAALTGLLLAAAFVVAARHRHRAAVAE